VPGVFIKSTDESELGAEPQKHELRFCEARGCVVQDKNLHCETVRLQACARAMNMLERILAALDRSTAGARALELAIKLARELGADLKLIVVLRPLPASLLIRLLPALRQCRNNGMQRLPWTYPAR
jgi:hypothetical protein